MTNDEELKAIVKDRYSKIAEQTNSTSCCGGKGKKVTSCCGSGDEVEISMIGDEYKNIKGHVDEADLSLGCGIPTKFAAINKGDTVIDLGSGAGNDAFVARQITGETGKIIGIDMTPAMIKKAESIVNKLGYNNIQFLLGEIESMPLEDNTGNVVISNCVLNLVPNKQKAFNEIYRVLKPGGHFCISDIVLEGILPEKLKRSAELYAGCVAGAIQLNEYLDVIKNSGFKNAEIKLKKKTPIPNETLKEFLEEEEIIKFKNDQIGLYSITVVGYK
jgi:arsenite methyltransferase